MFLNRLHHTVRNFVFVSLMASCAVVYAVEDEDYSAGLTAFISGNYELAQAHWLKSAKKQNYRAMFNLGLLHDQGKIGNAEPDKADRWFRLAGKGGYAAADYHHATRLIEASGDTQQIRRLLERAAKNGYQPAIMKLHSMSGTEFVASAPEQVQSAPLGTDPTAKTVVYLGEKWLMDRESSGWTIQLLAFQDQTKVREFINLHRLHDRAAYFVEENGSGVLYKLVYGAFASKDEATLARENLTPALQENGPWLRTLAGVQEIIKK